MINDETKELIQGFLLAPKASLSFLQKEMGLALIQNIIVTITFPYLLYSSSLQVYPCAPISMCWLTSHFIFNFIAVIQKLRFLPRLLQLRQLNFNKNQKMSMREQKKLAVSKLKTILMTKLYQSNVQLSHSIIYHYILAVIIIISDLIYQSMITDECYDHFPIRYIIRAIVGVFAIKIFYSFRSSNKLEKKKSEECLQEFLVHYDFDEIEQELLDKQEECSICLVQFNQQDKIAEFQCTFLHLYHSECITNWLSQNGMNKSCPICRQLPN